MLISTPSPQNNRLRWKTFTHASTKNRLLRGFGLIGVLVLAGVFFLLTQVAGIFSSGYQLLEDTQPIQIRTQALKAGSHHLLANLEKRIHQPDQELLRKTDEIWRTELQPAADSIRRKAETWPNGEKKAVAVQLLHKVDELRSVTLHARQYTGRIDLREAIVAADVTAALTAATLADTLGGIDVGSAGVVKDAVRLSYNPQLAGFLDEKIHPLVNQIGALATTLIRLNGQEVQQFSADASARLLGLKVGLTVILLSLLGGVVVVVGRVLRRNEHNLRQLNEHLLQLAEGKLPEKLADTDAELNEVTQSVNLLTDNLRMIREFAQQVGQGSFDNDTRVFNDAGDLGQALAHMRDSLKQVSEADKIRYWTNEGLAKFGEMIRGNDQDVHKLSEVIISQLVKYLQANQGGFFVVNKQSETEPVLELTACYAFERKKYLQKTVAPGQGLIGQAWLEAETIYLREIPQNYIRITSGLGGAAPSYLLIVPLKLNGEVHGVLELASFHDFPRHAIEFTEKIAESIASAIASTKVAEQTRYLLREAQTMTEHMTAQEEEMRQNMEELQTTQEEMFRAQREILEKEANVSALLNNNDDMIFMVDRNLQLVVVNQGAANFYAQRGIAIRVGMNLQEGVSPQNWDLFRNACSQALRNEKAGFQLQVPVKDTVVHLDLDFRPVTNAAGQVTNVAIVSRDITRFKREEELKNQQIADLQRQLAALQQPK